MSPYTRALLDAKLKKELGLLPYPQELQDIEINLDCDLIEELKKVSHAGYSGHSKRKDSRQYIIEETKSLFLRFNLEMNYKAHGPLKWFLEFILDKAVLSYDENTLIEDIKAYKN